MVWERGRGEGGGARKGELGVWGLGMGCFAMGKRG